MPGFPSHRHRQVPACRGMGVDHEVLHDLDPDVPGGLKPERGYTGGKVQIVVDRLGNVHDLEALACPFLQLESGKRGVVSADRDQSRNPDAGERRQHSIQMFGLSRGIGARGAEIRPASEMNAADLFDRERPDPPGSPLHEPFKAVENPDDVAVAEDAADCGRADHAVDTWGRSSTHENTNGRSSRLGHVTLLHLTSCLRYTDQ